MSDRPTVATIVITSFLLGSNERQEHVEGHLYRVDKDQTVLGRDELEVDSVHNGPDLPRSLHSGEEIVLDLIDNSGDGVSVDQTQVSEEDTHEHGAPEELINSDLESHVLGFGSRNLGVQPVVEVVSRGSMVDETKDTESDESLHVEWSSGDENL